MFPDRTAIPHTTNDKIKPILLTYTSTDRIKTITLLSELPWKKDMNSEFHKQLQRHCK